MMNEIKPIETYYNGYRFRSRLEARWAVFFDSLGIPYLYEPEGFVLPNGDWYLPDFYLPDCKQFFEVKGTIRSGKDWQKIQNVAKSGHAITVGYDNGISLASDWWNTEECEFKIEEFISTGWLCQCEECGKYWFTGSSGSYACQCCGAYDGDHHFRIVMDDSDGAAPGGSIWDVAKQARFEHGEKP